MIADLIALAAKRPVTIGSLKASEFSHRISNAWDIGGLVASYHVSKSGTISEIAADFYPATPRNSAKQAA